MELPLSSAMTNGTCACRSNDPSVDGGGLPLSRSGWHPARSVGLVIAAASASGCWPCCQGTLSTCPPKTGSFDLLGLNATACDGAACAILGGTVEVHAFAPECATQDCGHLEADLILPAATSDGGPSVSGTASLYYDHSSRAQICTLDLGGGD